MNRLTWVAALVLVVWNVSSAGAQPYPVTVTSCDRFVTFDRAPQRAVSQDVNLTSMMVALGLQSHMAGYTGITGWNKPGPEFMAKLTGIPELASHYPTVETLLGANADFYFAGWNYGMRVGGDVTPQTLAPLGIQVYELGESCSQIMSRPKASMNDVYQDILNLGRIFDVQPRAQQLVAGMQARERLITQRMEGAPKPRVFVYDSGLDRPFTAGSRAMPQALIDAAGGINTMAGVDASWTQVGWESVVAADPQVIVIVDYGATSAAGKIQWLEESPALQSISAIRNQRFVVLPYSALTPGVENIEALDVLANGFRRFP